MHIAAGDPGQVDNRRIAEDFDFFDKRCTADRNGICESLLDGIGGYVEDELLVAGFLKLLGNIIELFRGSGFHAEDRFVLDKAVELFPVGSIRAVDDDVGGNRENSIDDIGVFRLDDRAATALLDFFDEVSRLVGACAFVSDENIFHILTLADTLVIDSLDSLQGSFKSRVIHIGGKFHRVTGRGNESLFVTVHDRFAAELVSADFDRLHGRSRRFRQKRDRLIGHIRAVGDRNRALRDLHAECHTGRRAAFLTVFLRG